MTAAENKYDPEALFGIQGYDPEALFGSTRDGVRGFPGEGGACRRMNVSLPRWGRGSPNSATQGAVFGGSRVKVALVAG